MINDIASYNIYRKIQNPNLLMLVGSVSNSNTSLMTLITNLVVGKNLHSLLRDSEKKIEVCNH